MTRGVLERERESSEARAVISHKPALNNTMNTFPMQQRRVIIVELIKEMIVYCYPLCGCRTMVERVTQQKTRTVQRSPYSSKPPPHTPSPCSSTRTRARAHRRLSLIIYFHNTKTFRQVYMEIDVKLLSFHHIFSLEMYVNAHTNLNTHTESSLVGVCECSEYNTHNSPHTHTTYKEVTFCINLRNEHTHTTILRQQHKTRRCQ